MGREAVLTGGGAESRRRGSVDIVVALLPATVRPVPDPVQVIAPGLSLAEKPARGRVSTAYEGSIRESITHAYSTCACESRIRCTDVPASPEPASCSGPDMSMLPTPGSADVDRHAERFRRLGRQGHDGSRGAVVAVERDEGGDPNRRRAFVVGQSGFAKILGSWGLRKALQQAGHCDPPDPSAQSHHADYITRSEHSDTHPDTPPDYTRTVP